MKNIIKLEEAALFILALLAFAHLERSWWLFLGLLFLPDLSMLGYLAGPRLGAAIYNIVHHRGIALILAYLGFTLANPMLLLAGIILFAHSSMDRIFGYGLKLPDSFQNTHLGKIGK
jgi:hypothetical protein